MFNLFITILITCLGGDCINFVGGVIRSELIKEMASNKEEKIKELLIKYDPKLKDKLDNPLENKIELKERIEFQIPLENPNIEYLIVDDIKIVEFYRPKFEQYKNNSSYFIRSNIEYKSFI